MGHEEPATGKTSVRNPYKKLWQDHGISWPHGTETKCDDDSSPIHSTHREKCRGGGDGHQLAIGMQESLGSLPVNFNLDEFGQNTACGIAGGYLHDSKRQEDNNYVTQNTKKTNLDLLAHAALQLELDGKWVDCILVALKLLSSFLCLCWYSHMYFYIRC